MTHSHSCSHTNTIIYVVCIFNRAVAAGPVSPVSTGPLFPSLVACLALPISAIAWRTPTQHSEAHRYYVETCEMAANSATELFRESSNNFLKLVLQASPAKGVAFG